MHNILNFNNLKPNSLSDKDIPLRARPGGAYFIKNDNCDTPKDECGIFGIFNNLDSSRLAYFALRALQHRGTEAAGISVLGRHKIELYKNTGLVSDVFDEDILSSLSGSSAIGHVRYSTTGASTWKNAQPFKIRKKINAKKFSLCHNGNIINLDEIIPPEIQDTYKNEKYISDTFALGVYLSYFDTILEGLQSILPRLKGAFCLLVLDSNGDIYAARDKYGLRPLSLGSIDLPDGAGPDDLNQSDKSYCIASETCAFDIINAKFIKDIAPGEILHISKNNIKTYNFAGPKKATCIFEYIYLARADSKIDGISVFKARYNMGKALAKNPPDADIVIGAPDSAIPAALGYAKQSGIPYAQGITKNAYVGRSFIAPTDEIRKKIIKLKLNPIKEIIEGKRIVIVDDSIVRGNTQKAVVQMLKDAGAKEIHIRISSPPVKWPCFYGIDFATPKELIANNKTVDEICKSLGADSLEYISLEDMTKAVGQSGYCAACFNGVYPAGKSLKAQTNACAKIPA